MKTKLVIITSTQLLYTVVKFLTLTNFNYFFLSIVLLWVYKLCYKFCIIFFLINYYSLKIIKLSNSNIIISLVNGYNNIHPLLFYYCLINLWKYFIIKSYKKKLHNIFYYLVITLILGGLWGWGNSVWGFFWVNDYIELILLQLILVVLFWFHTQRTILIFYLLHYYFIAVLLMLYFGRNGVIFTRHNFFNIKTKVNLYIYFVLFFTFFFTFFFNFNTLLWLISYQLLNTWFFWIIFLWYFIKNFNYLFYNLKILHCMILLLLYNWYKYKQNNLINYGINYFLYNEQLNIYINMWVLTKTIFIKSHALKIFYLSLAKYYYYKTTFKVYFIITVYGSLYFLISLLISMCKTYVK